MKNIVVDVDLTVVDTDLAWMKYLQTLYQNHYGRVKNVTLGDKWNYDLGSYFPELGSKVYDFWDQDDLYNELVPKTKSVEVLQELYASGEWNIFFASYCKKGHFGNKYDWCKKNFPFMKAFFATKEKEFIKADVFVDDRNNMLNNRGFEDKDCMLIKMKSPYTQCEIELHSHIIQVNNWKAIEGILL